MVRRQVRQTLWHGFRPNVDEHGQPWATPVFFAPLNSNRVWYLLVRGGNAEFRNDLDMTVEL